MSPVWGSQSGRLHPHISEDEDAKEPRTQAGMEHKASTPVTDLLSLARPLKLILIRHSKGTLFFFL